METCSSANPKYDYEPESEHNVSFKAQYQK